MGMLTVSTRSDIRLWDSGSTSRKDSITSIFISVSSKAFDKTECGIRFKDYEEINDDVIQNHLKGPQSFVEFSE